MKLRWWNKLPLQKLPLARLEKTRPILGRPKITARLVAILSSYPGCKNRHPHAFRTGLARAFAMPIFSTLLLVACSKSKPTWEYMPDMANQPSLKFQKYDSNLPHHRSMLTPPPGTIPRNYQPYSYKEDPERAGLELKNPLPRTEEVLLTGQRVFNTYCIVCHGPQGLGNGSVVPPFPKPPSLHSEKVRNWPDGRVYHVITMGQNLMPSYASQIEPEARWAVIHYIRALQRAENATKEDVETYKKSK